MELAKIQDPRPQVSNKNQEPRTKQRHVNPSTIGGKAMKTPTIVSFLALMLLVPGLLACGPGDVQVTAKLNSPCIHTDGGTIYLQLSVLAPKLHSVGRRPVNLSIVLDRSGSMGERGKMDNAKKALYSLIDQLDERDGGLR